MVLHMLYAIWHRSAVLLFGFLAQIWQYMAYGRVYDAQELERALDLNALLMIDNKDDRSLVEAVSDLSSANAPCAALLDRTQCAKKGELSCPKCHLVKYCSKHHRTLHWSIHKAICESPHMQSRWEPGWKAQHRTPAFMISGLNPFRGVQSAFGRLNSQYIWGNTIAIDCFRINHLEGAHEARSRNFNIAFVASGDIRNMVHSINNLPHNYAGTCNVLLNDINPSVAARNAVVALTLMDDRLSLDEAAVVAAHFMYSVALPKAFSRHFLHLVRALYSPPNNQVELASRGYGKLYVSRDDHGRNRALSSFLSTYKLDTALKNMRKTMFAGSRVDYVDRHLLQLKPAHRVSFLQYRRSGILAPISFQLTGFTEPNRLLFSPSGGWLTMDSADPLHGWDVDLVIASGARHGLEEEDIYGCLYYHVIDELREFARRVRDMKINVQISAFNVLDLPTRLDSLALFNRQSRFDRIETSNVADYVGSVALVNATAPFLNGKNRCSTLFISYMNWANGLPAEVMIQALSGNFGAKKLLENMLGNAVYDFERNMSSIMTALGVIHDNSREFEAFLEKENVSTAAQWFGLKQRAKNRIHTKRYGIPIDKQELGSPELNRTKFYRLYSLGGCAYPERWIEFEPM